MMTTYGIAKQILILVASTLLFLAQIAPAFLMKSKSTFSVANDIVTNYSPFSTQRWPRKTKFPATEEDGESSDLSWLREALGQGFSGNDIQSSKYFESLKLGLSGFAVDKELGFVAILTGEVDGEQRFTHAVIAPTDRDQVSSREALCIVQLAGGHLGTSALPPDSFAQHVADCIGGTTQELRPRINLVGVDVLPNEEYRAPSDNETMPHTSGAAATPERSRAITANALKGLAAVRRLPGLAGATQAEVAAAMEGHADPEGRLDREGFSRMLDDLRALKANVRPARVRFELTVSVAAAAAAGEGGAAEAAAAATAAGGGGLALRRVPAPGAFEAVAWALRYGAPVVVAAGALAAGAGGAAAGAADAGGAGGLARRFPAFRPLWALAADARQADGFISRSFFEANEEGGEGGTPPPKGKKQDEQEGGEDGLGM